MIDSKGCASSSKWMDYSIWNKSWDLPPSVLISGELKGVVKQTSLVKVNIIGLLRTLHHYVLRVVGLG